jgi:hypothetical protein
MLIGLFMGHIVFQCYFRKTTNEALKKSEKYGYSMSQWQLIKSNSGLLHMFYNVYRTKSVKSLISNAMIEKSYLN